MMTDTFTNKLKWIKQQTEDGADEAIITFISNILFHHVANVEDSNSIESIRSLFADGYCYYFAKMLQDAFPGGRICFCYPYGHIVYIYNQIAYDIDGISTAEYELYIPIEQFGEAINDFRHIEGNDYCITKEELIAVADNWQTYHKPIIVKGKYDARTD